MTAIDLVALSKTFGSVAAVKDLTLAVADKEFVALLGPSGCGKTTTMNMIAGIETPTAGQILFDGVDVSKLPPPRRNIGFVFQNYAIFTHMSVRENLAFALQVRGVPRAEVRRRVGEMADLMRLREHLDRRAAALSVNEMQKLAIGRSAIGRPAIFLLDEPLSNVDAAFRVFMRSELKHIQRELQQTMVYVTHDQTEAMSLADRIAVMHQGLLQQVGTPEEVYNRPANTFVARFMGSPPMNLLPARLAQSDGATHLTCAGSRIAIDAATLGRLGRGGELLLGIRPEHIELAAPDDPREGLVLPVDMVEPIGPRVIVHLGKDGAIKAVAGKRSGATAGQLAKAILPVAERRYFDAAGGQAIGRLMAKLELEHVSKRYGQRVAVADVDLAIRDNEFFCIFGPPASGKTTLLKLWLGLVQPDSGRVTIDGRDMTGVAPGERNLAMVFQNLALFPHLTAAENIAFPLRERRVPAAEIARRVADAARRLHIEPLLKKRPGQLSGGERQRVAIGRTLVRDPRAFFMDEPIAALDARLREEMRVELKRLQRELKHTLVYVTHDQEEAMSVADRMAIMRDGRIVQIGTPRAIYDHPADRYVAALVGSPPMNLVPGRLAGGVFACEAGQIRLAIDPALPDGPVELGLRAEDLKPVDAAALGAIQGVVDEVEPLGAFTLVDVLVGERLLRIDLAGQPRFAIGSPLALQARAEACHLFRAGDGRAIWPRQPR